MNRCVTLMLIGLTASAFIACKKQQPPSRPVNQVEPANGEATPQPKDAHGHGSHGAALELGSQTIGGWTVRAARDEGPITAGKDSAIDVWLTGGAGKVAAVRFWIGAAGAEGSVKARAEIEDPAQPNHWHTHTEIPNPLPAGSMLWVELEMEDRSTHAGSFDIKL